MENDALIRIGVIIIVGFMLWLGYSIIKDLKGGDIGISKGDIYEAFKK